MPIYVITQIATIRPGLAWAPAFPGPTGESCLWAGANAANDSPDEATKGGGQAVLLPIAIINLNSRLGHRWNGDYYGWSRLQTRKCFTAVEASVNITVAFHTSALII